MSLGKTYVEGDNGELYTEPPLAGDGWHVGWDDGDMLILSELRGGSPAEAWRRAESALAAAGMQVSRQNQPYYENVGDLVGFICTAGGPAPVALMPKGRVPVQSWDRRDASAYLLFTKAARSRLQEARQA